MAKEMDLKLSRKMKQKWTYGIYGLIMFLVIIASKQALAHLAPSLHPINGKEERASKELLEYDSLKIGKVLREELLQNQQEISSLDYFPPTTNNHVQEETPKSSDNRPLLFE